jgi:anti-sigma B factor antagonist
LEFQKSKIEFGSHTYSIIEIGEDELGLTSMNELKELVDTEIEKKSLFICIDLKKVKIINSSGLGILISILKKVKSNGGNLKLLNANEKLLNIFKITKLNLVFDLENT